MSGPAKSFEDVDIWQKSHAFVLDVYRLTEGFPKHELFCLTSQLRRAAISIPANFAEGFDALRKHYPKRREFHNYQLALSGISAADKQWLQVLGFNCV